MWDHGQSEMSVQYMRELLACVSPNKLENARRRRDGEQVTRGGYDYPESSFCLAPISKYMPGVKRPHTWDHGQGEWYQEELRPIISHLKPANYEKAAFRWAYAREAARVNEWLTENREYTTYLSFRQAMRKYRVRQALSSGAFKQGWDDAEVLARCIVAIPNMTPEHEALESAFMTHRTWGHFQL